ncbi:hypothetical protein LUZ60_008333 [Juncus effusus]|nr:hypothetical protein LUZ60_008333 [Juncus effusus]
MAIYNIFVKNLDGRTLTLQIPTPSITGASLLLHLCNRSSLALLPNPNFHFRLISGTTEITPQTLISSDESSNLFPSLSILPRLRGGKGGFGSLLRGAASKAGQKKTSNFDACRDMSGRRLRHVNAEKKLEEWKAGEGERKLEKLAEDFLKKKAKEVKKSSELEVEKYLRKYKEDADRCVEEVEESVRESFAMYKKGKRKVLPVSGGAGSSKKLKIWLGKKKAEESESDSDSEEEKETKSVIIDEGNNSSSPSDQTETENLKDSFNPSFASGSSTNGENSSGSLETISEEEMEKKSESNAESDISVEAVMGPALAESEKKDDLVVPNEEMEVPVVGKMESPPVEPEKKEDTKAEVDRVDAEVQNGDASLNEPLNFDNYSSAAELEVLGMERLKSELQKNGLKCGGTLQERASRLFLLKTTPVDKLPKKLLAKK